MRVLTLTTGAVRAKAGARGVRRYLVDDWRDATMPVHAFLVEHEAGLVLFDTGQTARATEPGWFPGWQPFFRLSRFELGPEDEVVPQLRRHGIDPADVATVVLSHLHTDHVGGIDAFAGSRVLVSELEWRRGTGLGGRIRGYLPQHWPPGLRPELVTPAGPPVGPFPASHDLLGDGSLLLVPTPGHTPGHLGLVALAGDAGWLLAGDMAHTAAEIDPAVAAWCAERRIVILTAHGARQ